MLLCHFQEIVKYYVFMKFEIFLEVSWVYVTIIYEFGTASDSVNSTCDSWTKEIVMGVNRDMVNF